MHDQRKAYSSSRPVWLAAPSAWVACTLICALGQAVACQGSGGNGGGPQDACSSQVKFAETSDVAFDTTTNSLNSLTQFDLFSNPTVQQYKADAVSLHSSSLQIAVRSLDTAAGTNAVTSLIATLSARPNGAPSDGSQDVLVGALSDFAVSSTANVTLHGSAQLDALLLHALEGSGKFGLVVAGSTSPAGAATHLTLGLQLDAAMDLKGLDACATADFDGGNQGADASADAPAETQPDATLDGPDVGTDAGCPAGSVVPQFVTTSFTLTRACSPWHVTQPVLVGSSTSPAPVLTIEPAVTVLFDAATYLYAGMDSTQTFQPGALYAKGTSSAPIVFTSSASNPTPGSWGAIYVGGAGLQGSTLSWVTVEYAGAAFAPLSDVPTDRAAVIVDAAGYTQGQAAFPFPPFTNVTIQHSGGSGFLFFGGTGFGPGSGQLTVTDWATGGYPVVIDGNAADSIPATLTTGATGHDGAIGILCQEMNTACGAQDVIKRTLTWPSLAIPYVIENYGYPTTGLCGLLIDGSGSTAATLTIAAPNTLEFKTPCGIYVDDNDTSTGFLVAAGTAQNPIVMTSANATPAIGDWAGIRFEQGPAGQGASQLSHVNFSYAQAPAGGLDPTAAVWVDNYLGSSTGPTIQNCSFTDYAANCPMAGCCGIVASSVANNGAAYGTTTTGANGNTFTPGGTGEDVCPETD